MTYSCALFSESGVSLEDAQLAKLDRVCEVLDLGPDDTVLEIGTGWGSFAAARGNHARLPSHHDNDLSRPASLCDRAR